MRTALKVTGIVFAALIVLIVIAAIAIGPSDETATSTQAAAATTAAPAATAAPTTTAAPATTQARGKMVIEDFYLAADGETYYVEISGVAGATYCEAHLVGDDGRRTGEWSNELLDGSQDTATISLWDYERTSRPDGVEVECS